MRPTTPVSPTHYSSFLALEEGKAGAEADGPILIGTPLSVKCPRCDNGLRAALDLDLADPRLAFVIPLARARSDRTATRLRLPACEQCTNNWPIFADVDLWGGVANPRLRHVPRREGRNPFTGEVQLFRGSDDKVPFQPKNRWPTVSVHTAAEALPVGEILPSCRIGGPPRFYQDGVAPNCINCENSMTFVSRLESLVVRCQVLYSFVCEPCLVATTTADWE